MNSTIPMPGTPEHEAFLRRARNPNSVEAGVLRHAMNDASKQTQEHVRQMLHMMIDLVPGQLFRDIERFHQKFLLDPTKDPGHRLPADMLKFRIKFMLEELTEYCDAVGFSIDSDGNPVQDDWDHVNDQPVATPTFSAEDAFDALIDLVYVALGTAYLHRFPFNDGWGRVQEKNMQKVRTKRPEDSKRGSGFDVIKPEGWTPPVLTDLLDEVCPRCQGVGTCSDLSTEPDDCGTCSGTGLVKRKVSTDSSEASDKK